MSGVEQGYSALLSGSVWWKVYKIRSSTFWYCAQRRKSLLRGLMFVSPQEVYKGSPAEEAGLIPEKDFIIGSKTARFECVLHHSTVLFIFIINIVRCIFAAVVGCRDGNALSRLAQENVDQALSLYVFNTDAAAVREITIKPHANWGGSGLYVSHNYSLSASCCSCFAELVPRVSAPATSHCCVAGSASMLVRVNHRVPTLVHAATQPSVDSIQLASPAPLLTAAVPSPLPPSLHGECQAQSLRSQPTGCIWWRDVHTRRRMLSVYPRRRSTPPLLLRLRVTIW